MFTNVNRGWILRLLNINSLLMLLIVGLCTTALAYLAVSLGGGLKNLMSGFAGAALGGSLTLAAVVGSFFALKRQLAHSEGESARQRELQALGRVIDEFGLVSASLESRDFADHTAGRLDRTMDGVRQAATMLKLQLVAPDDSLLYVLDLWRLEISQRGYNYWRLRNGETKSEYQHQTSNALKTIERMIEFVTDILAEYGRTRATERREYLTRELALGISEASSGKGRWNVLTWVDSSSASPWIWSDITHPPVG